MQKFNRSTVVMLALTLALTIAPSFNNVKAATVNTSTINSKDSNSTTNNPIRIDNNKTTLVGTVFSKPTKDGVGYYLNTDKGIYSIIGPNAKDLKAYANTDKKLNVTGNLAVSYNILVVSSFSEYVQDNTTPNTNKPIRIDNNKTTLVGTVFSKPTKDGIGYYLNTDKGVYSLIGPNSKDLKTYANTDKKLNVTGNLAIGYNILVVSSFSEYVQDNKTPTTGIKIDNNLSTLKGTITSKPTNDGTAYFITTSNGTFSVIGPLAKGLSIYVNTDKVVTITGNLAIGYSIIVAKSITV